MPPVASPWVWVAVGSRILATYADELRIRTDNAFPEEVRLALGGVQTREFPVNLILYVAHCDECGDNTGPTSGPDYDPGQYTNIKYGLYAHAS